MCADLVHPPSWSSANIQYQVYRTSSARAAPPLSYYGELGANGYRLTSRYSDAEEHGVAELHRNCADFFPALRIALNWVADRHLFPATGDRIDRLLRQVADSFRRSPV